MPQIMCYGIIVAGRQLGISKGSRTLNNCLNEKNKEVTVYMEDDAFDLELENYAYVDRDGDEYVSDREYYEMQKDGD